jgi:hypothetical protein
MLVIQAISQNRVDVSEELQHTSNPKQKPTRNHQNRSRRLPRTHSPFTNRSTPTPTRISLRNTNSSRLNHSPILHSHIRSISRLILRYRFPSLARIVRDRVETDFRRARGLSRRGGGIGGD